MNLSIYDIARLAKVSPATVSRVLNTPDIVKEATRARVLQAIQETGYTPNFIAQRLAGSSTGLIGLSLQSTYNAQANERYSLFSSKYLLEFYRGVDYVVSGTPYDVVIINDPCDLTRETALRYHSFIRQKKLDGLIIPLISPGDRMLQEMIDTDFPFVYTGRKFDNRTYNVYASLHTYLHDVIQRFVELGHRKIGFMTVREQSRLRKDFLDVDLRLCECSHQDLDALAHTLRDMIRGGITACFIEDISCIAYVYQLAQQMGLRIPQELSLVSVEHELGMGDNSLNPVDAVFVPAFDIGVHCANLLLQRLSGTLTQPTEILIQPTLIERGTTIAR